MYYNIKIKSNNSEFCLNSTSREILCHEMDSYFAWLFDASEEFKANIKKIVIENPKVISIDEIEQKTDKINSKEEQEDKIELSDVIEIQEEQDKEVKEKPTTIQEDLSEIGISLAQDFNVDTVSMKNSSNETTPEIKFENIQEVKEDIQELEVKIIDSYPKEIKEEKPTDIEKITLSNEVEKKDDSDFVNLKDFSEDIETVVKEQKIETKLATVDELMRLEQEINSNNQEKTKDTSTLEIKKEEENKTPKVEIAEERKNEIQDLLDLLQSEINNANLDNNDIEQQIKNIKEKALELKEENRKNEVALTEVQKEPEPIKQEVVEKKEEKLPSIARQNVNISFGDFLAIFDYNGLCEEFLICAYFIKNFLNQKIFTMKVINSKLFQTTKNIADMSVVEELLSKGYIKAIIIDGFKNYSITETGEAYFNTIRKF